MKQTRGFTLVESIVAVSVVVLLMGILLPALGAARSAQRQMLCQSNLRQMGIAAQTYANTWRSYPIAIMYRNGDDGAQTVAWDWVTSFSTGALVEPGPLWGFTDHPDEVMQCPGYDGPSSFGGEPFTGYNYNTAHIGGEAMSVHFGWDHSIDHAGVIPGTETRPDQVAIFGCGGYSGGTNKFMRAPMSERHTLSTLYAGGQAFHYRGATNVGYMDGHVSSVSQALEGLAATENLRTLLGFPNNGFLSDGDRAYNPRK